MHILLISSLLITALLYLLARNFLQKIPPNLNRKYRVLMVCVIITAILATIWYSLTLYVIIDTLGILLIAIVTIIPVSLVIGYAIIWFRTRYKDDKLHQYFGYSFILSVLILSSIIFFVVGNPRIWLIPDVAKGVASVTEEGHYEYRIDIINNLTRFANVNFIAVNLETRRETVIEIPNNRLKTYYGSSFICGSRPGIWRGNRDPWDGTVTLIATDDAGVYVLKIYSGTYDRFDDEVRSPERHFFTIELSTGNIISHQYENIENPEQSACTGLFFY